MFCSKLSLKYFYSCSSAFVFRLCVTISFCFCSNKCIIPLILFILKTKIFWLLFFKNTGILPCLSALNIITALLSFTQLQVYIKSQGCSKRPCTHVPSNANNSALYLPLLIGWPCNTDPNLSVTLRLKKKKKSEGMRSGLDRKKCKNCLLYFHSGFYFLLVSDLWRSLWKTSNYYLTTLFLS